MTNEIHQPELEALIQQRMASGEFQSVEELLLRMFETSVEVQQPLAAKPSKQNLTQFLKESPLWRSGLAVERSKEAARQVEL